MVRCLRALWLEGSWLIGLTRRYIHDSLHRIFRCISYSNKYVPVFGVLEDSLNETLHAKLYMSSLRFLRLARNKACTSSCSMFYRYRSFATSPYLTIQCIAGTLLNPQLRHHSTHSARRALKKGSLQHKQSQANFFSSKTFKAEASNNDSNGNSAHYDYDLFCIGAGSGGVRASRVAASSYGAKVGICELPFNTIASDDLGGAGGTCVLRGCVPKKLFVYCSEYPHLFKDAQGFGWNVPSPDSISLDWSGFLEKKNAELRRLNGVYGSLLKNAGVEYMEGRGKIIDAHTVEVSGHGRFTAKNIVVATGARAFVPPVSGSEHTIISDQALELSEVPKSIAIIGAGYIAVEFAGIFAGLGSEVHVMCRQPLPLRGFDQDVREFATEQYRVNGLNIHTSTVITAVEKRDDGRLDVVYAHKEEGKKLSTVTVDQVLCATGRVPNTKNLGLEELGVTLDKSGAISVNEYSQSSVPSIWAIGDVTGRMALTPVALMEGMALTKTLFEGRPTAPDHTNVPTAVFSNPQIATVGMTWEQAIEELEDVDCYKSSFRPMRNTISGNEGRTFMKLIVDASTDRVVGCHMVGPDAAEIMQGMGVAVKMGVKKSELDGVVGIHPSAAEEFVTMKTVTLEHRRSAVHA